MPRAFWKGAISFGMVVIPVKMYVATQSKTLSFHLLHKKCLTRPKQVYYCEQDNEYLKMSEILRGYEFNKGQYIVLSEDDFKKVPVKTLHTIDIVGFVSAQAIDPIYFRGSHYLEPEALGVRPFVMLNQALEQTKRVGIAKVTFQKREHLCCLRPVDNTLILHTMYYHSEILLRGEMTPPKQAISAKELEMATELVNTRTMTFKPEGYQDDYHLEMKKMIEARLKGEQLKVPKPPKIEIGDLMSALKASIEAAKKESAPGEAVPAGGKRGK